MVEFKLFIGNKNYSSWSLRGWLVMKKTGAEFEEAVLRLAVPETHSAISAHSPSGLVPALRWPGGTVWDSLSITEFLAERFPEAGLWPDDPETRAVARSVAAEMHSGFSSLRGELPMNVRARYPDTVIGDETSADIRRIEEIWNSCRSTYGSGGPYLFGQYSAADAFYAPVVSRFRTYGVGLGEAAQSYAEASWNWPHMREWIAAAETEPYTVEKYER
ncbi:MAG: glutathione S-transferase family protein [Rhodospirillales bacterium]|nr:glutathione S-transferase family protein [Rhodospirillales bacterium]